MKNKQTDEKVDIIVLGGGDSGLLCAAYLAKTGAKTILLQKQKQWDIAGNLLTEEFQGPYHFDMMPPYMNLMADRAPCHSDLDLANQSLAYITPQVQIAFHHQDNMALVFHQDPEKSAASIARFSSADADRFSSMYAEFKNLSEEILIPALYMDDGDRGVAANLGSTDLGRRLEEISQQSPIQIIDSYGFESAPVREALLYLATFWGLDPEETGVGQVVPLWVYRLLNSTIPVAGNLAIARALYQSFLQSGGDYPGLARVERILIEGGKAVGVQLKDGRKIHAKAVISTLNVEETFIDLVGEKRLPEDTETSSLDWEWEVGSLLSCHYGYIGEAPQYRSAEFDPDANEAYINIFGIENAGDVERVYQNVSVGTVPTGHGRAVCLTQFDPYHAGFNHVHGPLQTLRFEIPAPGWLFRSEWHAVRDSYLQSSLETWRRYATGVVDGTLSYGGVLTPYDVELRLPSFKNGSFKGGIYTVDRIGYKGNRPACMNYRSEIPGLYMGGAATSPGGLINFASGYNAAGVVARDLNLKTWWQEPEFVKEAKAKGYLSSAGKSSTA